MDRTSSFNWSLLLLLLASSMAHAQSDPQPPADITQRQSLEQQLRDLRSMRQEMQQAMQDMLQNLEQMKEQVREFDSRIEALEFQARGSAPGPEDQLGEQAPDRGYRSGCLGCRT